MNEAITVHKASPNPYELKIMARDLLKGTFISIDNR